MKRGIWVILSMLAPALAMGQHTFKAKDIVWDQSTLAQVSGSGNSNYARMIQLNNGDLICIYESRGGIQCSLSTNLGKTWLPQATIAASIPNVGMAAPEILELKDHSLLASYNPRPRKVGGAWDTTKRFSICTKKSYDEGKTWIDERVLYKAGYTFDDGCWEPSQIQLPSGEIQLFFSNEGVYTHSNEQNISIFRSNDNGLTWTKNPEIVSFRPHYRDGMPVPVILKGTKELYFSIEDNNNGQFKPSIIHKKFSGNLNKTIVTTGPERSYSVVAGLPDSVYAGAPYLRQLHSGETVLSYQGTLNRINKWQLAAMMVAVGNNKALDFKNVSMPFNIPLNKSGLWNSLCVLSDDTIIALTSTNAFSNNTAVWMIKGHLVNK